MPNANHQQYSGCLVLRRLVELEPSFVSQVPSLDCLLLPFSQAAHGQPFPWTQDSSCQWQRGPDDSWNPSICVARPPRKAMGRFGFCFWEEKWGFGAQREQDLSPAWSQDNERKRAFNPPSPIHCKGEQSLGLFLWEGHRQETVLLLEQEDV